MVSPGATRLSTWSEVAAYLAVAYGAREGDARLEVPVTARTSDGRAVALTIEVRAVDVADAPWLALTCAIGSPRDLSALELLGNNARATVGAFCLHDGRLAVRQTLPLPGLRAADLEETVREIGQLAAFTQARIRALAG